MNISTTTPRVAFLGLGLMGQGMARRLLHAKFPLSVYNRTLAKASALETDGAIAVLSAQEAARDADVIISMLADDEASRSLWLGEQGALVAARPGAVLIECGTVTVPWIHELAHAAHSRDCELLDAPVTGSRPQAASGELTFLVGGDVSTLQTVQPVLAAMSRAIIHLGPLGSGAFLKLVNNFLCGVQAASLAEALAMLERANLDRAKALEVLISGAPGSPLLKTFSQRMATQNFEPNFLLKLMAKDLNYARAEGARLGLNLKTAESALGIFSQAIARGDGDKDVSAVVEQFRKS